VEASWLRLSIVPGAAIYCCDCCELWQPPCMFVVKLSTTFCQQEHNMPDVLVLMLSSAAVRRVVAGLQMLGHG
jgi:hypothetical protein